MRSDRGPKGGGIAAARSATGVAGGGNRNALGQQSEARLTVRFVILGQSVDPGGGAAASREPELSEGGQVWGYEARAGTVRGMNGG